MLIPSIDFQSGRVVQLVQGDTLAIESHDLDGWLTRFARFPIVQVIDLDAAMGIGDNSAIVRHVCARRACQVGGGVRTVARAQALLDAGATRVILGSSLFSTDAVQMDRAREFFEAFGADRLVAAVDSRGGHVTIHGWKTMTTITAAEAVTALSPFVGRFLYTHVDTEGTMKGLNLDAVLTVQRATSRRIIAAGGVREMAEVDHLDSLGIDAVVGMALYTGAIRT
ncbi:MAG: HisA/HisF-related TIM barrel protein [Acidobacteria bacterium]|nr:HisA/HisF-related TIM barrel protein [Acidobacteriota bacterium]